MQSSSAPATIPLEIWFSLLLNVALVIACVVLAATIVGLPVQDFGNLGTPVQVFAGLVLLLPAGLAIFASVGLFQRSGSGRFTAMSIYYILTVLAVIGLLHQWQFYQNFEAVVDVIVQNPVLLWGIAASFALYWLGGRWDTTTAIHQRLTWLALLVAGITLVALLLFGNVLNVFSTILAAYSSPLTWVITALVIVCGVLAYRLLAMADYFGQTPQQRDSWQGWLLLSPNIIGFMLFFAGPLLLSFYLSFTDSTVGRVPQVIGFQNYFDVLSLEFKTQTNLQENPQAVMSFGYTPLATLDVGESRLVIGAKDRRFWLSFRNTLLFCLLLVPLSVIPALALSMVLNSKLPGMKFFRAIYFLPSVAAVVGTALIWRWLYDPTIGYFNYLITGVVTGLNGTFGLSLADPAIEWLTGPGVVLFSVVFLAAWQVVGYNTVLFLAGLQGIPGELYEAAMIDGANKWRQFWNVTLPLLAPTTFFVMITTIVTGLQAFNEPYALFPSRPLPENATTSVFYLYE
ncbi:MAG: sugar ABC transporter permease, partial [Anaerolineae bacterium]|nr:sugar ABC transporter permease [Anaerolineae bacterium]